MNRVSSLDPSRPSRRAAFWVTLLPILVVVAGLLFLLGYTLAAQPSGASSKLGAQAVGSGPAADFTLERLDGGTVQLTALRGQPVMINFWASWCVPCRDEAPTLQRTWETYKDRGAVFWGVNIWDSDANARAFVREFGITYPNLLDRDGKVAIEYGLRGVPETFFVNRQGGLASKYVGPVLNAGGGQLQLAGMDADFLSRTLDGLL
jgi:cytochrome c biogenesis protein CcmG/thiol:disulfide interchange protein DsbE